MADGGFDKARHAPRQEVLDRTLFLWLLLRLFVLFIVGGVDADGTGFVAHVDMLQ
jgi:hypothetical protein